MYVYIDQRFYCVLIDSEKSTSNINNIFTEVVIVIINNNA